MKNVKTAMFVRKARKKLGLTQRKFAEKIDKSRCDIANYETGRSIPKGVVVIRIK